MLATVDRIERDLAVLLIRPNEIETVYVQSSLIPDIAEGDIVEITIRKADAETNMAKEQSRRLLDDLRSDAARRPE